MGDVGGAGSAKYPRYETHVQYSDLSSLNTLQTCLVRPPTHDSSKIWIIYIHGGAWRDPMIDASSFDVLQDLLLKKDSIKHVQGLASINYRLSSYASHSSNPSNPADPARNAVHPEHITDVLQAILYLQRMYAFEHRYILVGHSCGATLAFQVAMKRYWGEQYESSFASELNVVPPMAIIGAEGIYDIPAMLEAYKHEPAYHNFIVSAFGDSPATWSAVSPAKAQLKDSWPEGSYVCLVHSLDDELLGIEQRDLMQASLKEWNTQEKSMVIHNLHRLRHDEVWSTPEKFAEIVEETVIRCSLHLGE